MPGLLIDFHHQFIKPVDLSSLVSGFHQEVKDLLRCEAYTYAFSVGKTMQVMDDDCFLEKEILLLCIVFVRGN